MCLASFYLLESSSRRCRDHGAETASARAETHSYSLVTRVAMSTALVPAAARPDPLLTGLRAGTRRRRPRAASRACPPPQALDLDL